MTTREAARECNRQLEPWSRLKARVMLYVQVDFIIADGELQPKPRPSEQAEVLLKKIDEVMERIVKEVCDKIDEGERHHGRREQ